MAPVPEKSFQKAAEDAILQAAIPGVHFRGACRFGGTEWKS
jgi:hypothetical protein